MAIYYVDTASSGGNGTTTATSGANAAFATIAAAQAAVTGAHAGDSLLFKTDCIWREQFTVGAYGTSSNVFTIGAYGGGALPIINGADLLVSWTPEAVGGFTAYYATLAADPLQVYEDGTRYTIAASKAALVAGSYWWDSANARVYVRTSGDDSPAGYAIEGSVRSYGILNSTKSYITSQYLNVKYARSNGIWLNAAMSNITFDHVIAECNYDGGLWGNAIHNSQDYVTLVDSEFRYNGRIGANHNGAGDSWWVHENSFHHNGWNTLLVDGGGFRAIAHDVVPNAVRATNLLCEKNVAYSNGRTGGNGKGLWFDTVGAGCVMRYNKTYSNTESGLQVEISDGTVFEANVSYGNVLYGILCSNDCESNLIYNNTCYGNTSAALCMQGYWPANSVLEFNYNVVKNNILVGGTNCLKCTTGGNNDGVNGTGNVYEYNCLGAEAASFVAWGASNKSTYDAWETAYGGTTHSVEADPLFTNAAGGDFTLQAGSPCVDAGANLGATHQMALRPGSTWPG